MPTIPPDPRHAENTKMHFERRPPLAHVEASFEASKAAAGVPRLGDLSAREAVKRHSGSLQSGMGATLRGEPSSPPASEGNFEATSTLADLTTTIRPDAE